MINSENSGMTVHDRGMQIMNILESLFCVGGYCLFLIPVFGVLKDGIEKHDDLYCQNQAVSEESVMEIELFLLLNLIIKVTTHVNQHQPPTLKHTAENCMSKSLCAPSLPPILPL